MGEEQMELQGLSIREEDNEQGGSASFSMQGTNDEQELRYDKPKKEWIKRFTMTHTHEKPFICRHCNESFPNPHDLIAHVKATIGKMQFKCSKCGKSFTFSSYAKERMRPCSSEKPSSCSECGLKFSYSEYIRKYIAAQTEKPYKCSVCKKIFLEKQPLEKHMKIHRDRMLFLLNWLQRE